MPPLRLLVASAPGAGKTTLCTRVQERLKAMLPSVHGFLSREAHNARGFKIGYELYSINGDLSELVASCEGPESKHMVAKYNVYTDALDRVAIPILDAVLAATGSRVCIIDDIGNITTKSDSLVDRVRRVLESKDPGLHVLAALGMGNSGFILDVRKIFGVKTMGIDESTRDSVCDSLTTRLLCAAQQDPTQVSDDEDDEDDELEDNDLTKYDRWGGDERRLGITRGMYDPEISQETVLSREAGDHPLSRDTASAKVDSVGKPAQGQSTMRWMQEPQKQTVTGSQKRATSTPAKPDNERDTGHSVAGYNPGHANGSGQGDANGYRNTYTSGSGNGHANAYANGYANGYSNGYANYHGGGHANDYANTYGNGNGTQTVKPTPDGNCVPYGLTEALRLWLDSLDPDGFLCSYATDLGKLHISSPDEAIARYTKDGVLSSQFFADAGIKKLGHRRLFERWFRESANVL